MRGRALEILLHERRVGVLSCREDHSCFQLDREYLSDPARAVLGLEFENEPLRRRCANLRIPVWFSHLLPEGRLREWVAQDRGVSSEREFELLAHIGGDLPGAVVARPTNTRGSDRGPPAETRSTDDAKAVSPRWKVSLAGAQLKFSMLQEGDRFTMPAVDGVGGDWIVKTPDHRHLRVPENEFAMMKLASSVGIEVPEIQLVHRDELPELPKAVWPNEESLAYAIKRFDRLPDGKRVHIEDLAQVRRFREKYRGSFETIAALIYRGHDMRSLEEFVRRLTFNVLIQNGDAHLKNWSLIYRDPRVPVLSPAYDLVATGVYTDDEDLGLEFGRSKRFQDVRLSSFRSLGERLRVDGAVLLQRAAEVVDATLRAWPKIEEEHLASAHGRSLRETITRSAERLRR